MKLSRRSFLSGAGAVAVVTLSALPAKASPIQLASLIPAQAKSQDRYLKFYNQHTGESFEGVYRYADQYIGASLHEINRILRDFRSNEVAQMDPKLLDILFHLNQGIRIKGGNGDNNPYEVISAYRCKKTNDMLRAHGEGVAKNSYHVKGQAIDIRINSFSTKEIKKIALDLQAGGVGYYPSSNFVHVDTGPVRNW